MLQGIGGAPGIAIGRAFIFKPEKLPVEKRTVKRGEVKEELAKLQRAITQCHSELAGIYSRTIAEFGRDRAGTFQAQLMVLEDPSLESEISDLVRAGTSVEAAVAEALSHYINFYRDAEDEHIRERWTDYRDVGCRLLRILLGESWTPVPQLEEDAVVIARDVTMADIVHLDRSKILAFATESGSRTSTAAILARSLDVPAVVSVGRFIEQLNSGDLVIVDGSNGRLIINPDAKTLADYENRRETYRACKLELQSLQNLPAVTRDGHRVEMFVNVYHVGEVDAAMAQGAEGIGLLRTEHIFMGRDNAPGEEEQYRFYASVVKKMKGRPVVVRTLDMWQEGGVSSWCAPAYYEPNPFLGCRGIRLSLNFEDIYLSQLRAILRASALGTVKVMFPMVSRVGELRRAKILLDKAKKELDDLGVEYERNIPVGMLVEVPSAALMAELFAREVDFFSLGTNDLVQYTLAVDRMSDASDVDQALHPAVLRLVKHVADVGREAKKPVAICGEVAAEPLSTMLWLGLGVQQFSCAAGAMPELKKVIRAITLKDARDVAKEALLKASPTEVKRLLEAAMEARRLYF